MPLRPAGSLLTLVWLASVLTLGGASLRSPAHAQAASGLAGSYRPSPQRIEVQIVTWGDDCGPRPQSQTITSTATVSVRDEGAHLALRFSDRTLKTNGCWSPNPAVKLVSTTSAGGHYRAECKTVAGDAKREIGRYAVDGADGRLELHEESDYDWQLKTSHCVAKLRMTQTLTSTKLPAPPAPPTNPPQPGPISAGPCVPGTAARLRLRPADTRITPGDRACFSVRALDAAGCTVELPAEAIELSLVRPPGAQGTLNGTCFKAAANTAQAEGVFKVVATGAGLRAEASVTVSAPDLSDITARRGTSSSRSFGADGPTDETTFESGVRAVAAGSHGTLWLGVVIAALAGILSLIAITALRIARKQARHAEETAKASRPRPSEAFRAEEMRTEPPVRTPAAAAPPPSGPQRICPKCRRGYAPGTERCETDGETLLDYEQFAKRAEPKAGARFCPECGDQLLPDSMFCGRCGHKLAPP